MTSDSGGRARDIFREALGLTPAAREAFLDDTCAGDRGLRTDVETLLAQSASLSQSSGEPDKAGLAAPQFDPGTRLGPYEVVSLIGSGGMGEVYKGRDTRLDRTVAIKVLPAAITADEQLRRRFEREGRTISQLNHPHICTLYDVGRHAGVEYLVMEHLEGETLAARLARGRLRLDQVFSIARDVLEALDTAHSHGVTHRDLKPANVMLTPTGAKLLDFGLAKLRDAGGAVNQFLDTRVAGVGQSGATRSDGLGPHHEPPITDARMILGTVPYMAPEQVEGREADARTDMFAFGLVLYEMATGRRAFEASSQAGLIGAILLSDPPPIRTVDATLPAGLDALVKRCLAKDPDHRWQSARDLLWHLEMIETGGDAAEAEPAPPVAAIRTHAWWAVAVVVAATLTGLVGTMWNRSTASEPASPRHLEVGLAPADAVSGSSTLEVRAGAGRPSRTALALSPDGSRLVFVGRVDGVQQLFVRSTDSSHLAVPLEGTEGAESPFFSPDGLEVGFWRGGWLRRISTTGGPILDIVETGRVMGASWSDVNTVVYSRGSKLWSVAVSGGATEQIAPSDEDAGSAAYRLPHVLPGARAVLYTDVAEGTALAKVGVWSLETRTAKPLLQSAADGRYVPTGPLSGHLVFMRSGVLMTVPFDPGELELKGAETVLFDVMQADNAGSAAIDTLAGQYTFSDSGDLAYIGGGVLRDNELRLSWFDRTGRAEPLSIAPADYSHPRVGPGGRRVSVRQKIGFERDLLVINIDDGRQVEMTEGRASRPLWAPDGLDLVFAGLDGRPTDATLKRTRADGSGVPMDLGSGYGPAAWGPNGELIILDFSGGVFDIKVRDPDGEVRDLFETPVARMHPAMSPDGAWLAYSSKRSGNWEVYVRRYPSMADRKQVSEVAGGNSPLWCRNGREIIYREPVSPAEARIKTVPFDPTADEPVGTPQVLFQKTIAEMGYAEPLHGFDVTPDCERLLGTTGEYPSLPPPPQIKVILNWFDELRLVAPPR